MLNYTFVICTCFDVGPILLQLAAAYTDSSRTVYRPSGELSGTTSPHLNYSKHPSESTMWRADISWVGGGSVYEVICRQIYRRRLSSDSRSTQVMDWGLFCRDL